MIRRLQTHWTAWRRQGADDGMALISVLSVLFLLTAFLMVTLAFVLNNQAPTREEQDDKAATAAAQAGLDDYLARLQSDKSYWKNTPSGAGGPVSGGVQDTANKAFTTGVTVGSTGAKYSYKVTRMPNKSGSSGRITLSSTGLVNGVSRTLSTTFGPDSFLNYVYFSDKENLDPLYTGQTGTAAANCSKRWWQGRNTASGCSEIQFASGDKLSGPVHTNDTPLIGGSVNFTQKVTTATMTPFGTSPTTACVNTNCYRTTGSASFVTNRPAYGPIVNIPSANTELLNDSANNGCVYFGATHITFNNDQMSVYSPGTTTAAVSAFVASGQKFDPTCYNTSAAGTEQTINLRPAVYVTDLAGTTCTQANQIARNFPRTGEKTTGVTPSYACNLGTAYIKGTVRGDITVGSTQDVIITGNLRYATDPKINAESTDIVGLVPGHSVWVYKPVNGSNVNMLPAAQAVTRIDAAILTISDSFIVQHYNAGARIGNLTVYGSLAQNFRGTVGTNSPTGYLKDYQYDQRFAAGVIQPTYFLQPTGAKWNYAKVTDG